MDPWFITGLTDGEGCFSLFVRRDLQKRKNGAVAYYRWTPDFAFTFRGDDLKVCEQLKIFFGCGIVSLSHPVDYGKLHSLGQAHYSVRNIDDIITKIIPHFDTYSLQSKKNIDYVLWKEAIFILKKYRSGKLFSKIEISEEDKSRLQELFDALKKRLTAGHLNRPPQNPSKDGIKETII